MTPPKTDGTRQVATRVSREAWELLEIGLLLEEAETMQDLLRPVVEQYARELAAEPEVQAVRNSVVAYRDRKRGSSAFPRADRGGHLHPPAESAEGAGS